MGAIAFVMATGSMAALVSMPQPATRSQQPSAQVDAVREHLNSAARLEVFDGFKNQPKVKGFAAVDIDSDGLTEVFVWTSPRFLQSPTIVIFKVDGNGRVARIREGLAPGPLVKASSGLEDSHVHGLAVDLTIGEPGVPTPQGARNKFVEAAMKQGGHIVAYSDFFHLDSRKSGGSYLDLSHKNAPSGEPKCEGIAFSRISTITAGMLFDRPTEKYFVAVVDGKAYLYRIFTISEKGFLTKEETTVDLPAGFSGFSQGAKGQIMYLDTNGTINPFPVSHIDLSGRGDR